MPVGNIGDLEPGQYMGPMRAFGVEQAVVFRAPEDTVKHNSICHVTAPPWRFRECSDGSLEIRESIAMLRGDGSHFWHGYLDEGNVWRVDHVEYDDD